MLLIWIQKSITLVRSINEGIWRNVLYDEMSTPGHGKGTACRYNQHSYPIVDNIFGPLHFFLLWLLLRDLLPLSLLILLYMCYFCAATHLLQLTLFLTVHIIIYIFILASLENWSVENYWLQHKMIINILIGSYTF